MALEEVEELNQETTDLNEKLKDNSFQWHVFYVRGKYEKKAYDLLQRDGFIVYLPLITVQRQYTDRKKKIIEPLFKSYIFVLIKRHQLYDVIQTPGVVTYVRFATEHATIRKKEIELIKKLILNKTQFEVTNRKLKVGQQITLTSGAFKGQKGIVKQIRGKKRLLISLEAIEFTLEIEL